MTAVPPSDSFATSWLVDSPHFLRRADPYSVRPSSCFPMIGPGLGQVHIE